MINQLKCLKIMKLENKNLKMFAKIQRDTNKVEREYWALV